MNELIWYYQQTRLLDLWFSVYCFENRCLSFFGLLIPITHLVPSRRVWRDQGGNQNPYIEEEQTTQWPKEKVQKDKQRSTKHTHKGKDRVKRTPLKAEGELRCSGRVGSFCSASGTVVLIIALLCSKQYDYLHDSVV